MINEYMYIQNSPTKTSKHKQTLMGYTMQVPTNTIVSFSMYVSLAYLQHTLVCYSVQWHQC